MHPGGPPGGGGTEVFSLSFRVQPKRGFVRSFCSPVPGLTLGLLRGRQRTGPAWGALAVSGSSSGQRVGSGLRGVGQGPQGPAGTSQGLPAQAWGHPERWVWVSGFTGRAVSLEGLVGLFPRTTWVPGGSRKPEGPVGYGLHIPGRSRCPLGGGGPWAAETRHLGRARLELEVGGSYVSGAPAQAEVPAEMHPAWTHPEHCQARLGQRWGLGVRWGGGPPRGSPGKA